MLIKTISVKFALIHILYQIYISVIQVWALLLLLKTKLYEVGVLCEMENDRVYDDKQVT